MTSKLPLLISFFLSLSFISFKSYTTLKTDSNYALIPLTSSGLAATFGMDRTGSPISGGQNCSGCHSGASNNSTITITVIDAMGTTVTNYTPGTTYDLFYSVESQYGIAKGFQSVILGSANSAQAGTIINPGPGAAVVTLNGRQYLEHYTTSFSANYTVFTAEWVAPNGQDDITFYASGIAGNGNGATSGDEAISPVALTLTKNTLSNATFELNNNIKLFPNPSNSGFNIDLGKVYKNTTIEITNLNGQLIKTINSNNEQTINFNLEVAKGLYFAKVKTLSTELVILKLSVK